MTDEHLIRLLNTGCYSTMETIYRRHYAYLCTIAHQKLNHPNKAEDIVQDLMMDVWRRHESIHLRSSSLKTYLTQGLLYKIYRLNKSTTAHTQMAALLDIPVEPSDDAQELRTLVRRVIDRLPERQRDCFTMSRDDGMTYAEIAEQLGISPKTVDHHISKALSILRESISRYMFFFFL